MTGQPVAERGAFVCSAQYFWTNLHLEAAIHPYEGDPSFCQMPGVAHREMMLQSSVKDLFS